MADRSSGTEDKAAAGGTSPRDTERYAALGAALRNFGRHAELMRDRLAKRAHMHPTDFNCIGYLHTHGPSAPRDIIAFLGLTSGSGTALFDRLESEGYIKRLPNPQDRRSVLIELLPEKSGPVVARYIELQGLFISSFESYEDHELDLLVGFLERMLVVGEELEKRVFR